MTFNIHHGKGTDGKLNLKRIAQVIEKSDVDIIGLNEVDKQFSKRSDYIDQAAWLADHLQMYHAFGPTLSLKTKGRSMSTNEESGSTRQYGNALLSRYPILFYKNHPFHSKLRLMEGRALLETTIDIGNTVFNVFTTHLSLNPLLHKKQTDKILDRINTCTNPVIVFGDWNMKPKSKAWVKLTENLTDVLDKPSSQNGYTFPSNRPRMRLDYIFVSKALSIDYAEVVTNLSEASDHLPIKAVLRSL
jgi:endonuclease/exonuclease/phosphatase family metal-dependent hydrolase